jgi:tetratricopeptide (TPR) repeat protein
MNLIDVFAEGRFLGSMIKTMNSVFPHVTVFAEGVAVSRQPHVRNTFILAGTKHPVDFSNAMSEYDSRIGLYRLKGTDLAEVESRSRTRVLTDDWAPVENLLAPVVRHASREIAANVLQDRAAVLARQGKQEKAIEIAQQALDFFPDAERAHGVLGDILLGAGKVDEAIRHYEDAIRIRPSWSSVRVNLGSALARRGRFGEAERELMYVVQREPQNASAQSNLGIVLMQLGRSDAAVEACRRAIAARPDYPDAWNNLGVVFFRSERLREAVEQFEQALRIDPNHRRARENLQRARAALRSASENAKDSKSRK